MSSHSTSGDASRVSSPADGPGRLMPIRLQGARVSLARGRDFEETCRRMHGLSAEMGTRARPEPDGLTVEIPEFDRGSDPGISS